jgi:uncharacterized membrane protein YkoI
MPMRRENLGLAMQVILGLAILAMALRADEAKVALDKVPNAVMNAIRAKHPAATITGASTEKEEGKTVYEIALSYKDHNYDVTLTPEGKITAVEKTIAAKDLPRRVVKALGAKYPGATYQKAEELSRGDDKVSDYEVLLVTAEKKTIEVELDAKGKILKEATKEKKKEDKERR